MTQWFYALDMLQNGPVTTDELVALHASGQIDGNTQVWRDGLSDWQPLSMHHAELGLSRAAAVAPREAPPSPPAASPPAASAPASSPAASAAATPYAPPRAAPAAYADDVGATESGHVVQAGLLRRWAALIIDSIIIGGSLLVVILIGAVVFGVFAGGGNNMETFGAIAQSVYYLLYFIAAPIYYAGMESSASQATLGKQVIGIKVCDAQGRRLGFAHALGRWAAAALSYLTLYIGFLMAAFTEKKQALHDLIAGTLVVDKWAYTAHPERQKSGATGCLVIALVLLIPVIFVLGILLAIAIPAYSDYSGRARVSEMMIAASPVKIGVSEYVLSEGRCPQDWDDLNMPALSGQYISNSAIGEDESGACVIEITAADIDGITGSAGKRIWLVRDDNSRWSCSSELPSRALPASCR